MCKGKKNPYTKTFPHTSQEKETSPLYIILNMKIDYKYKEEDNF